MEQELLGIERSLWKNDAEIYGDVLLPEAVLVFAETGAISRDFAIEAITGENDAGHYWAAVRLDDVKVVSYADDTALLSYRSTARWNHEIKAVSALCSSLYLRRDGRWRLAFHQQSNLT